MNEFELVGVYSVVIKVIVLERKRRSKSVLRGR